MSSSWSSKPRLDVRRHDLDRDDDAKEDDSFASSRSGLSDPLASSRSLLESPKAEKDAQRRKKKKERSNLIRMMENSTQDVERRERFDGSFREEEGISRGWQEEFSRATLDTTEAARAREKSTSEKSPPLSPNEAPRRPKSLNRGGAREIKVNSRLSQRSQRLLATYYESTDLVASSRSCTDESAGEESEGDIHVDDTTLGSSIIDDTKNQMLRLESEGGKESTEQFIDEPPEDAQMEKSGLAGIASRAASMVDDLSNKAWFMSQRESTRADITAARSQRRQRRSWRRFDEPGAVQMHGRAYGAPPRPPDAKPTTVMGLSDSTDFRDGFQTEDQLLMEEGVKLTSAGPLVEAKAVDEDEYAPRAFAENDIAYAESTPLAIKHMFQERHVRRRLLSFCLLVALVTMCISVSVTHFGSDLVSDDGDESSPGATPTPAPTFVNDEVANDLVPFSGHEALSNPSSPQSRACGWLSSIDKSGLNPSDVGFIQRYVLVTMYFSMGGENWLQQEDWLDPEKNVCEWSSSIHCARDHSDRPCVTAIDLSRAGLEGNIPPEIGYLDSVESINLSKNNLNGPIPRELFMITSLTELVLSSNILSSTIPSSISNAEFLDYLDLSENYIAGSIPDEVWDLQHMRTLNLSSNELTGTISGRLENLKVLHTLDLSTNMIGGNIPDAISFLPDLAFVRLDENRLLGHFPVVTTAFVQLQEFTVSHNFLSGTIPSLPEGGTTAFQGLSDSDYRLQRLNIAHNNLKGLLPEFIGWIPSLREFRFADNEFDGTYPSMPGMWRSLEVVSGAMNQLTGTPPTAFPPTLTQYDFHANMFSGGLPPAFFDMFPRMEFLSLAKNPLGGTIPSPLSNMPHLVALDLRECDLMGPFPDISGLNSLGSFDIRQNSITGTMPADIGALTSLTSLKLASNKLTGTIVPEIGNLSNLGELLLEDNELTGSLPDTLTNLGDLVEFRVVDNQLEGEVPEELCDIVEGLSVDHVGCDLVCNCCVDENVCDTS